MALRCNGVLDMNIASETLLGDDQTCWYWEILKTSRNSSISETKEDGNMKEFLLLPAVGGIFIFMYEMLKKI